MKQKVILAFTCRNFKIADEVIFHPCTSASMRNYVNWNREHTADAMPHSPLGWCQ